MPADLQVQVVEMRSEMEVCKKVLKQHKEDSMRTNSDVSSHCLNHCLNPTENYTCDYEHQECEMCVKPFRALALVDLLISILADERRKKMFQPKHEVLLRNVVLFMGHVVRSVVQRPMQDATLDTLSENTRLIVVDCAMKWLALYAREQQSAF